MRAADDARLVALIAPRVVTALGRELTAADNDLLQRSMPELKKRSPNLNDLALGALFYLRSRPIPMDDGAAKLLASATPGVLAGAYARLAGVTDWSTATLEEQVRALADEFGLKLGQAAQPLRAAVTGSSQSPGLFDVMETLGRDETLGRIDDVITGRAG